MQPTPEQVQAVLEKLIRLRQASSAKKSEKSRIIRAESAGMYFSRCHDRVVSSQGLRPHHIELSGGGSARYYPFGTPAWQMSDEFLRAIDSLQIHGVKIGINRLSPDEALKAKANLENHPDIKEALTFLMGSAEDPNFGEINGSMAEFFRDLTGFLFHPKMVERVNAAILETKPILESAKKAKPAKKRLCYDTGKEKAYQTALQIYQIWNGSKHPIRNGLIMVGTGTLD